MATSAKGDGVMIKLFLDKSAHPNLKDAHGNTAFDYAEYKRHRAMVQSFMSGENRPRGTLKQLIVDSI